VDPETLFVDRHDESRRRPADSRRPALVGVESSQPYRAEPDNVGKEPEQQEESQQQEPEGAATTAAQDTEPPSIRPRHPAQDGRLRA